MPAPITFDTMMAAASSGPRRRASDVVVWVSVMIEAAVSSRDEPPLDRTLADADPLLGRIFREEVDLRVDELRVLQHLGARFRSGVAELHVDGDRLRGRARL